MNKEMEKPSVLYLDNHLLVINKPAGLATHEDGVHKETLRLWAEKYLIEKLNKPGRAFVVPVHRLDRLTSGIVLFAKTDKALTRLMEAFRKREVNKQYRVRLEGFVESEGQLDDYLIRKESKSFTVDKSVSGAQRALLSYKKVIQSEKFAECLVDLETGRHHQIRVQFAARGHPVIGDLKYGSHLNLGQRIMLHHERLEILHPVTGEQLVFKAPLSDFWL